MLLNDNIGINLVLPLNLVLSNICDFQTYKCGTCFSEGYGTYIVFIVSLFTSMCIKRTDCSSTFYQLGLWYVGNKCINDWWIYLDISCLWQNSNTLTDLPVRKRVKVIVLPNMFVLRVFDLVQCRLIHPKWTRCFIFLYFSEKKSLTSCLFMNSRTKDCINCLLQINKSQKVNVLSELKI